jgi:hypothetical protein
MAKSPPTRYPVTITAAGKLCGVSRITAGKWVRVLGLGQRLGDGPTAPLMLAESDVARLRDKLRENSINGKFKPGNDLWKLGQKYLKKQKKKAESVLSRR